MIDIVKKFFDKSEKEVSSGKEKDKQHDIRIAACALFIEMSNVDGEFTKSERGNIISILKRDYHLSDEDADALIEASDDELKKSIDLWKFATLINRNYSIDEKIQLIKTIWRVAYTDGRLDKHEDYLVHKLANLLQLTHKQLIEAKLNATKEHP